MKYLKYLSLLGILTVMLSACSRSAEVENAEEGVKLTLQAELSTEASPKFQFEHENGIGVKNTWEEGDIIRLFPTTNAAGIVDFVLTEGGGTSKATFSSTGLAVLNNNTTYRGIAMSATQAAAKPLSTLYNNMISPTSSNEKTQTGNDNMDFIAGATLLKSTNDLKYETVNSNSAGMVNLGTFEFATLDYAILATQFELPAGETASKIIITNAADGTNPTILTNLNLADITPGKQVTAYCVLPNNTALTTHFVIDIITTEDSQHNYQAVYTTLPDAPAKLSTGMIYVKDITSDLSDNPGYYLRQLQAQINNVSKDYTKSLAYLQKGTIRILDGATPALSLYTNDIRASFNARNSLPENKRMISVEFPYITSFASGAESSGCFVGVTSISSVTAPIANNTFGNYCFYGCTGLESVTAPNMKTIGSYAFANAGNIQTNETDLEGITTVNSYAFDGSMTSKLILENCATLSDQALINMNNLSILTLPSVTKFGLQAFSVSKDSKTVPLEMTIATKVNLGSEFTYDGNSFQYRFADDFMYVDNSNPNAGSIKLTIGEAAATNQNKNNARKPTMGWDYGYHSGTEGVDANGNKTFKTSMTTSSSCSWPYNKNCLQTIIITGVLPNNEIPVMRVTVDDTLPAPYDGLTSGQTGGKYWWTYRQSKYLQAKRTGNSAKCVQNSSCSNVAATDPAREMAYGGFENITVVPAP